MTVTNILLQGTDLSKNPLPAPIQNPKVLLRGKFKESSASFGLDASILSKHMLLVGGTGCGKTTLFYHIIEQLKSKMTDDDVMIIFDTKGDFYKKFYRSKDCVLGNSSQYYSISKRWNIMRELLADGEDDRVVQINAQEICKAFFSERVKKSGNNPFFPNAARDLMAAILIVLARLGKGDLDFKNSSFYNDLINNFLNCSDADSLVNFLKDYPDMVPVLSYIEGGNGQSQGVLSELYSVMREVFIGVFGEHGGFSIRNFVRKKGGRTLFIEYDLSIGSVLTPVYKLLIDQALKEALGRTKTTGNVYLICDEFKLLPNLDHIDDGVNFGRSLGVKVFAGIQSIEQLYEIYGEHRGNNIAAGFSTVVAFKPNDPKTRQYVSNLFGKNLVLQQYRRTDNRVVEDKREGHVVEDWDFSNLRVGEAIVGLPFQAPFRFYFDLYTER